jgi:hypothetical protein
MSNTTLLGVVGDAAGLFLRRMACANADCLDAMRACRELPRCDIIEVQPPATRPPPARRNARRARQGQQQSMATLRASWTTWGAQSPKLRQEVARCKKQNLVALAVPPGQWLTKARRQAWQQNFCDEYTAARGEALPDFGRALRPHEASAPAGTMHCPPAGTRFLLITYQNGPSPWLCTFLRTLGYEGVAVTVLGWQPREFVRANNVFYFTDRVYTLLRYLTSCRAAFSPGASVMFCDVDELYQLGGGADMLIAQANALYGRTGASVIISAEARCMPDRLGKPSWAHSEAVEHMHKKWPRCLNTGNFVGRIDATIDLLNRTCIPCRSGLSVQDIFRRYTRAYSAEVRSWVYSEQAELMRLYLARPANVSGWILDYRQQLFHPSFWFTAAIDMRVLEDGRIMNRYTASTPAFMHYNGDSKRTWRGQFSPSALARALRRKYVARTGDEQLKRLPDYLRMGVSILGPTFVRDERVVFDDICRQGSIADL